jgi:hypothetical protein
MEGSDLIHPNALECSCQAGLTFQNRFERIRE